MQDIFNQTCLCRKQKKRGGRFGNLAMLFTFFDEQNVVSTYVVVFFRPFANVFVGLLEFVKSLFIISVIFAFFHQNLQSFRTSVKHCELRQSRQQNEQQYYNQQNCKHRQYCRPFFVKQLFHRSPPLTLLLTKYTTTRTVCQA